MKAKKPPKTACTPRKNRSAENAGQTVQAALGFVRFVGEVRGGAGAGKEAELAGAKELAALREELTALRGDIRTLSQQPPGV